MQVQHVADLIWTINETCITSELNVANYQRQIA